MGISDERPWWRILLGLKPKGWTDKDERQYQAWSENQADTPPWMRKPPKPKRRWDD